MVAILDSDFRVEDRLDRQAAFGSPTEYSEAWRRDHWRGSGAHLAFLLDDEERVRWLGRARGGRAITSRDRIVSISEVFELDEPLPLERLEERMQRRHQSALRRRGILPPAAGMAVRSALLEVLPHLDAEVKRLERAAPLRLPAGSRGDLLAMERDAVGLLLEFADMPRAQLRQWQVPNSESPFLSGLPDSVPIEDALIAYDLERFLDWAPERSARVEWRVFTKANRRLLVMNANRTVVERTLGVDAVYFNEALGSFVLVQYKKLQKARSGARESLFYRPDANLASELDRMRRVDALSHGATGPFRLLHTPCWLKLTEPTSVIADPAELLPGMYFAREHFESLLLELRGPRGGVRIGYDNVPRYMNNTLFAQLVQDGWIGSRGIATEEIKRLVEQSLATGRAVVLGVETGQPRRARRSS